MKSRADLTAFSIYFKPTFLNLLLTLHPDRLGVNQTKLGLQAIVYVNTPSYITVNTFQTHNQITQLIYNRVGFLTAGGRKKIGYDFKTAKYDTWSILFYQVLYLIKKFGEVSLLVVFLPSDVFDVQSYCRKRFSTKSHAPIF